MDWQTMDSAPRDGSRILLAGDGVIWISHWMDREVRDHGVLVRHSTGWARTYAEARVIEPVVWCPIAALPVQALPPEAD